MSPTARSNSVLSGCDESLAIGFSYFLRRQPGRATHTSAIKAKTKVFFMMTILQLPTGQRDFFKLIAKTRQRSHTTIALSALRFISRVAAAGSEVWKIL